jgi:hypothetical protein
MSEIGALLTVLWLNLAKVAVAVAVAVAVVAVAVAEAGRVREDVSGSG